MAKKKLPQREISLHDKAIRLLEGGIVEFEGLCVKAVRVDCCWYPCDICNLDSICRETEELSMVDLCRECDAISGEWNYLELV